jgi:hypothetical protein
MERGRRIGRCWVFHELARGGMASVHFGRLVGDRGFSRLVAVKMVRADRGLSSHAARGLEAEARIGARIQHPNVVPIFDVVGDEREIGLVMEYVHGLPVAELRSEQSVGFWAAIVHDALLGLHASHEATDATGRALGLVHRDVSPQNVLVGVDGIARLMDFGIARGARSEAATESGAVKGKTWYMSPEQRRGLPLTRQADVFSAGVMLAEMVTGMTPSGDAATWQASIVSSIDDEAIRDVARTATASDPRKRFASAAEMADALSKACIMQPRAEVGRTVATLGADVLEVRADLARAVEAVELEPSSPADETATITYVPPVEKRGRRGLAIAALGVLSCAAIVVVAVMSVKPTAAATTPAQVVAADSAPRAPTYEPPSASVAVSPPAVSPEPIPTTAKHVLRRAARKQSEAPSPPKPDCDPPFRVDANGTKHFIAACLE